MSAESVELVFRPSAVAYLRAFPDEEAALSAARERE
jgi:hypothetical protein